MAKFIELPHGYGVDADEILYYQVLMGDTYSANVDYNKGYKPVKLLIHFKNGDDLEIPDFEQYMLERFWDALPVLPEEESSS